MLYRGLKRASTCLRPGKAQFHETFPRHAAANFLMPAMSPTMTEGNIATWKLKEGDTYSAGDVILEIETDKATMDVEATDDGILAKILIGDGQKNINVGTKIAVTAEPGDDVASLEMPRDVEEQAPPKAAAPVEQPATPKKEEPTPKKTQETSSSEHKSATNKDGSTLSPAVQSLLAHFNITDPHKIPATGPKGRLVKGDILAFANKIDKSSSEVIAKAYAKRGKLDLSNIKKAPATAKPEAAPVESKVVANPIIEIRKQVNLIELILLSEKISEESGVDITIQELVSKATAKALKDVPSFALSQPSKADELFAEIIGTSATKRVRDVKPLSPQKSSNISLNVAEYFEGGAIALPTNCPESTLFTLQAASPALPESESINADYDILDFLTDKPMRPSSSSLANPKASEGHMIASLSFKDGFVNGKVASLYLDRVAQYVESPAHLLLN